MATVLRPTRPFARPVARIEAPRPVACGRFERPTEHASGELRLTLPFGPEEADVSAWLCEQGWSALADGDEVVISAGDRRLPALLVALAERLSARATLRLER